ncbi:MAG: poly-beta-1,6-N-acetyl-D-glucosamine N-deacetylase PgaB [Sulfuricurvum sp.]|jgi:biofilm PGA synthesis lipoprotein PgaB|uniref:poly-beta-1,6-N-acetyl-D-glucosamine N-deacetylase PgaB n=1 Tax=Sulfuricurvum sp. TaxID=2025608 RepID=UPI0025DB4C09|nr:poly-beta-1,6-N-acetyl-D-glucosamine N-deacetylase PgaB [Sulfuricurvum sp.]MCK9373825.1 poly-beta-1,6-N-acetyl-D-glucosamine N-deacetylase PgaB [Sulfuricurvum sp.]
MANELPNVCSRDQNVNEFTVLSYHEIADKSETLDTSYAVSPSNFEQQIRWLIESGYHFITVDDILKYRKIGKALPDKAVLITFDDGYRSVYTNAYPILKKYRIPAVIALVGNWMRAKEKVDFDGHIIDRSKFLSQSELKEMISSGLVEIASHSYGLHKGVQGNPQGSMQPAATTRRWLADQKRYEDEKSYEQRVYNDLLENSTFLKRYTGQKPRVIVWPYGRYNIEVRTIAEKLGMPIGLTLDDGSNTRTTPLWGLRRILVEGRMSLADLEIDMWERNANLIDDARTTKAAHIDIDYIYDPDPIQREKNLGLLLERINKLGVNTVYVQAFADPDGDGSADYVYFRNRHIPMKDDFFNRVTWQIAKATQVKRIYAWMPMMAWRLPQNHPAANDTVVTLQVDPSHLNMGYHRLSPFSPKARQVIEEIYADLAKSAYISGILFHDDVTLSDFEDDSLFARQQYKKWGLSENVSQIRSDRAQFLKWTKLKTRYLDDFAIELGKIVRKEQPELKTARNLYAQVALHPDAEEWYAQNLAQSIQKYDYTAIMAMPYMEQADDPKAFYQKIVNRVKEEQCGLERTVMELQSVNWRKNNEPISRQELSETIRDLYAQGVHHVAYYPDDVYTNTPDADTINRVFSEKAVRMFTITPGRR